MARCGAMLQVGPHLCTPTVQSSIWLRDLALTRAQVEETMEGAAETEEEADRMTASSWHHLSGISAPFTSFHLAFLFSPSAFLLSAPQDSVERWRETEPSQLHLVIISHTPAAASPCLLSSCALTLACFTSLVLPQPWLMGISNFWFLAVCACECAVRQIKFFFPFLKQSVSSVRGHKHAAYQPFPSILHGLFPHGDTDLTYYL